MKRVVIIGANSFQNPLILKAKQMGFETHVFAWKEGSIGEKTADYFYPISILNKEEILDRCRSIHPDAVMTIASDLAQVTVNYLCQELGLPCNSPQSTLLSTNKYEMRRAFASAGLRTPRFEVVSKPEDLPDDFLLPCIVKPTDRSGSRSITQVLDKNALEDAINRAVKESFESKAIVEEFIEGAEYSCECISFAGKHHFLALTKKFTTNAPHFIETAHLQPSGIDPETEQKIVKEIFAALDALQIKYGASHAEFRMNDRGEIGIIEIGARMGGDCIGSHLVELSTGYDFLKMVVDVSCGIEPELVRSSTAHVAMIRFLFDRQEIEKINHFCQMHPELVVEKEISHQQDHAVVDSSSRLGYVIFCSQAAEQLCEIIPG